MQLEDGNLLFRLCVEGMLMLVHFKGGEGKGKICNTTGSEVTVLVGSDIQANMSPSCSLHHR